MPLGKTVREVMHRALVTCDVNTPLQEAGSLILRYDPHAVIVVDEAGEACGMFTATDLVRIFDRELTGLSVEAAMSTPVVSISPFATLAEAAETMLEKGVHQLVVMHGAPPTERRPVGLVTRLLIVKHMLGAA